MRRSAAVRADDRLRPDENPCPLRFKLDPTSGWDEELIKGLAETRFRAAGRQGPLRGLDDGAATRPDLYRRVVDAVDDVDDVCFEAPKLTEEIEELLAPYRSRITWGRTSTASATSRRCRSRRRW
jgi:hypothetical protein